MRSCSQEVEGEWTENEMARVKNANTKALCDQINTFTSVISNTNSPKKINSKQKAEAQDKTKKDNGKNSNKSKVPNTCPNGPFC